MVFRFDLDLGCPSFQGIRTENHIAEENKYHTAGQLNQQLVFFQEIFHKTHPKQRDKSIDQVGKQSAQTGDESGPPALV